MKSIESNDCDQRLKANTICNSCLFFLDCLLTKYCSCSSYYKTVIKKTLHNDLKLSESSFWMFKL